MRLTRIEATGYRSLYEFDTAEIDGILILVGPNMAGKSNFIKLVQAFRHLLSQSNGAQDTLGPERFYGLPGTLLLRMELDLGESLSTILLRSSLTAPPDEADNLRHIRIALELTYDSKGQLARSEESWESKDEAGAYRCLVGCKRDHLKGGFSYDINPDNVESFAPLVGTHTRRTGNVSAGSELGHVPLFQPQGWISSRGDQRPYIAELHAAIASYMSGWSGIDPVRPRPLASAQVQGVKSVDASGTNVLQFLDTLQREDLPRYGRVLQHFMEFFPSVSVPRVTLGLGTNHLQFRFQEHNLGVDLSGSELSDGSAHIFRLLGKLFEDLDSPRVLWFEEPENHLHPGAQRALLELIQEVIELSKSRTQVIITTHSEVIALLADLDAIRIVQRHAGKTKVVRPSSESYSSVLQALAIWPGIYYDADLLVYLEGPTDVDLYSAILTNGLKEWFESIATEKGRGRFRVQFERLDGCRNAKTLASIALYKLAKHRISTVVCLDGDSEDQIQFYRDALGDIEVICIDAPCIESLLLSPSALSEAADLKLGRTLPPAAVQEIIDDMRAKAPPGTEGQRDKWLLYQVVREIFKFKLGDTASPSEKSLLSFIVWVGSTLKESDLTALNPLKRHLEKCAQEKRSV